MRCGVDGRIMLKCISDIGSYIYSLWLDWHRWVPGHGFCDERNKNS